MSVWGSVVNVGANYLSDSAKSSASSSGGGGSNIWGSILNGVSSWYSSRNSGGGGSGNSSALWNFASGAAGAYLSKEAVEKQGEQSRKLTEYEANLADYYKQKDKARKRVALDTYGQFSLMNRWAPNATAAPALDQPAKPSA